MAKFIDGIRIEKPSEKAPSFVLYNGSIKVDTAIAFLTANQNERGYVNFQILQSKEGRPYLALNDFKKGVSSPNEQSTVKATSEAPEGQNGANSEVVNEDINPDDIPF